MAFKWNKNNESNILYSKDIYEAPKIKSNDCSVYHAAFSPTCTNRGKYRKEVRLCWDTIKNLKYVNNKFIIDNDIYKILHCEVCEDYYIEKDESNKGAELEQTFKCYECFQKENE